MMIKSLLFILAMSFVLLSESFSQTNKIQEVGNVGIGTTSPSAPLEVAGNYNDFTQARNAIVLRNNGVGKNKRNQEQQEQINQLKEQVTALKNQDKIVN